MKTRSIVYILSLVCGILLLWNMFLTRDVIQSRNEVEWLSGRTNKYVQILDHDGNYIKDTPNFKYGNRRPPGYEKRKTPLERLERKYDDLEFRLRLTEIDVKVYHRSDTDIGSLYEYPCRTNP